MVPALGKSLNCIKEVVLRLFVSVDDGLSRILRKLCIFYYKLVQVVTKKISASIATMAIEYSKETTFWPVFNIFFRWRLHDI